jgi:hypothetical protein
MSKTIQAGTTIEVLYEGRIRHVVVESVTNQNNVTVRLGRNSAPVEFAADRRASTTTRGTLFVKT